MSARRQALIAKRERLLVRSAAIRIQFAVNARPFRAPMAWIDQARYGLQWLKQHPIWPAGAAGLLLVVRPRRALRLGLRGWAAWRLWRRTQPYLQPLAKAWRQGPPGR